VGLRLWRSGPRAEAEHQLEGRLHSNAPVAFRAASRPRQTLGSQDARQPRTEWCPQGAQGTVIGRLPAAAAYSHHAGVDSILLGSGLAERGACRRLAPRLPAGPEPEALLVMAATTLVLASPPRDPLFMAARYALAAHDTVVNLFLGLPLTSRPRDPTESHSTERSPPLPTWASKTLARARTARGPWQDPR
jgi:hypothetical protein